MAGRFGARTDRGLGLGRVDRTPSLRASGLYPDRQGRQGIGGTAFPTVLEAYNRDSDYKRWRMGQEYYFGAGKSWADYEIRSVTHYVLDLGLPENVSRDITTLFPSRDSPDRSWYVSCRTRGSIALNQPLEAGAVSLDTRAADPSRHRLILDVSGSMTAAQIQNWALFLGDQFEDSATGLDYPADLIQGAVGSIALTLVDVDPEGGTLVFDLSRPYRRRGVSGRVYWERAAYNPLEPRYWVTNGSRYLTNSCHFHCTCPDYSGRSYAHSSDMDVSGQDRFPLPSAGSGSLSAWASGNAGYFRQWRELSTRQDERRECKHIHAVRWAAGVPFFEPSDCPTGTRAGAFDRYLPEERRFSGEDVQIFNLRRELSYDVFVPSLAVVNGLNLEPRGDVSAADPVRPDLIPILWAQESEPLPGQSIPNDWWLKRSSKDLRIFSPEVGGYVFRLPLGAATVPLLEVRTTLGPGTPVYVL